MADTALFSSFRRPKPPSSDLAAGQQAAVASIPVQADPLAEIAAVSSKADSSQALLSPQQATRTDVAEAVADQPRINAWATPGIPLGSDQLGLAHPDVIALQARLRGHSPVLLEANTAGIYRPPGFRPAPWSGFAYDQPAATSTGLAAGTRILTSRGEIEVERLVPGDSVMALRGPALLPISWIGRTAGAAPPILIEPGALGPDLPRRLLRMGPDQAVFLKPDPVAAKTLVNDSTIRHGEAELSDFFHIDVGRAEIILAEGLAVASGHRAGQRR